MPLQPTLFTIEGLSTELARDRRTLARALRTVPADGKVKGRPAWRISTVLSVLRSPPSQDDGTLVALEQAADTLEVGFERLRREPVIAVRRKLAHEVGPYVGAFFDALDRTSIGETDSARVCNDIVRNYLERSALGEFLGLLELQLDEHGNATGAAGKGVFAAMQQVPGDRRSPR
jgi:hypothetical protein